MKHILAHMTSNFEDYESLSVVSHRYGSSFVAALTSTAYATHALGIMADDGGDAPSAFLHLLQMTDVPVAAALGETAEAALDALNAKLAAHPPGDDGAWSMRLRELLSTLDQYGTDWAANIWGYDDEAWLKQYTGRFSGVAQ